MTPANRVFSEVRCCCWIRFKTAAGENAAHDLNNRIPRCDVCVEKSSNQKIATYYALQI